MSTELIRLIQEPIIEEQLRTLRTQINQTVSDAMALVCNEETVQTVKAARAELNKQFSLLEDQRKAIKAAVLDPYNRFEAVYKECVSVAFKQADICLKNKINEVEGDMKRHCEEGLREYFAELCMAHHIDFLTFEQAGITVSMTDAKSKTQPPKRLREKLSQFVAKVDQDIALIASMDDADEIMVAYKVSLNAAEAIGFVQERHRRIEAERAARAEREAVQAQEAEVIKKVEAFAPPVEQEQLAPAEGPVEEPKIYRSSFVVTAFTTRSEFHAKLKKLKEFMNTEGIKYE